MDLDYVYVHKNNKLDVLDVFDILDVEPVLKYKIPKPNTQALKAAFFLSLAVSSNFIGEIIGCDQRYYISNYMWVKHLIVFLTIYFTANIVSEENPHPLNTLMSALGVWILFLLFTKLNGTFTAIAILLLVSLLIMNSYSDYYDAMYLKKANNIDQKNIDKFKLEYSTLKNNLELYKSYALNGLIVIILIGFGAHIREIYTNSVNPINLIDIVLGEINCSSH